MDDPLFSEKEREIPFSIHTRIINAHKKSTSLVFFFVRGAKVRRKQRSLVVSQKPKTQNHHHASRSAFTNYFIAYLSLPRNLTHKSRIFIS